MPARRWKAHIKYDGSWYQSCAVETEERALERLSTLMLQLYYNGDPIEEGRITGPSHSVRYVPEWGAPGVDFSLTPVNEL